jgi:integrase
MERINGGPKQVTGPYLIQDENGHALLQDAMHSRFDKARKLAGLSFQFRDIRAKAASDTGDLSHSQKLLGHRSRDMTEHYVRSESVRPLQRDEDTP